MTLQQMLFPNHFKKVGWFLLIPSVAFGLVLTIFSFDTFSLPTKIFVLASNHIFSEEKFITFSQENIIPSLTGILITIGALLVGFSKEKNEDEYIASIRLSSLLWAVLLNSILMTFTLIFIWGNYFFNIMLYNMFTPLLIFIIRFNYLLYRSKKENNNE